MGGERLKGGLVKKWWGEDAPFASPPPGDELTTPLVLLGISAESADTVSNYCNPVHLFIKHFESNSLRFFAPPRSSKAYYDTVYCDWMTLRRRRLAAPYLFYACPAWDSEKTKKLRMHQDVSPGV